MKSIKQVTQERPEYKTLINAVVRNIGKESITDVINHGGDSGFSGFIYYSETHSFAMRYRKLIIKLLEEQAYDMDEEVVKMVSNFGVFYDRQTRISDMDNDDRKNLYKYIGGGKCEQSTVTNVMAWFALEEVCRMFVD